ncbi:MAG TPA: VOC family protein [Bryobacteraceae bacterium]|nr:VOC family protein [Bryobacteraceae bacterium]
MMFQGLEHTAIASPDPKKLAQWYVDNLGFHINFSYEVFFFVKAPNGTMLEIIPSDGVMEKTPPMKEPGIRHLAIAVDDFDAAHQDLKQKGIQFLGEPYTTSGNRLVFFKDGDGNILHLIHRERPLP